MDVRPFALPEGTASASQHSHLVGAERSAILPGWLTIPSTSAILRLGSGHAARSYAEQQRQHSGDRERCGDTETRRKRRRQSPWSTARFCQPLRRIRVYRARCAPRKGVKRDEVRGMWIDGDPAKRPERTSARLSHIGHRCGNSRQAVQRTQRRHLLNRCAVSERCHRTRGALAAETLV